ncbi:hypothetical protein ACLOJK_003226 [Asimina triloba]
MSAAAKAVVKVAGEQSLPPHHLGNSRGRVQEQSREAALEDCRRVEKNVIIPNPSSTHSFMNSTSSNLIKKLVRSRMQRIGGRNASSAEATADIGRAGHLRIWAFEGCGRLVLGRHAKATGPKLLARAPDLRRCASLEIVPPEGLTNLQSLNLSGTKIREFPHEISTPTSCLEHLDLTDARHLATVEWGKIVWSPKKLKWDQCGCWREDDMMMLKIKIKQ